ncbi:MAG: septation protein IspZ [Nevskia sp.]|nr:septation protein IspZ [Nevskia sp.]
MNTLIDLLPAVLFFTAYWLRGIYAATAVLIAACVAVVLYHWLRTRSVPKMQLVTAVLAAGFGGLTLWLHNPEFIKLKFSVLYALFALVLLGSHFIGDRVLLARIPQDAIKLPDTVWRRVNLAWVGYFLTLAVANLYIAEHFSEAVWVKFKFACMFLPMVFVLLHAPFLARYLETEPLEPDPKNDHAR